MAIQGIFLADFSQYNAAVDVADAKLRKFTSATTTHDSAVSQFNRSTANSSNQFGVLAQGLSEADRTLGTFGVHIQHEIHALEEISQAAGKTAGEIGLIGTATFVAAAAFGGWELGKKLREVTDLDESFSHWIDTTFHLSVATEEAAAKQDVLERASKNAGRTITDYGQAILINKMAFKEHTEAVKDHVKQLDAEKKAAEDAAAALTKEQEAYTKRVNAMGDDIFGNEAISKATDWVTVMGRVENVENLSVEALKKLRDALFAGLDAMVQQGQAGSDLANTFTQFILEVDKAAATHTAAITKMETDEERFKRENDELAKAMKENFVVIGQSAQDAAQKVAISFSDALDAVRAGQGTLTGMFQSIAPGTPGSTIRYDDYGNPYGYIPGVNQPGQIAPPAPAGSFIVNVNAQNSFYDTPGGVDRLADKVANAISNRTGSSGLR